MRFVKTSLGAIALAALAACSESEAPAKSVTVVCAAVEPFLTTPMTLAFSDNTLKVTGGYGELALPASHVSTETKVDNDTIYFTQIEARGSATLQMPDRAAFDACVASRANDPNDKDMVAIAGGVCAKELPAAGAIPADADIDIVIVDKTEADVSFNRGYPGSTGPKLEIFPPLSCKVRE